MVSKKACRSTEPVLLEEPPVEVSPLEELPLEELPPLSGAFSSQLHRTVQLAVRPVEASLTVMVAVPGATAVTVPLSDTVATSSSLELQVRAPPAGVAEAFSCQVAPAMVIGAIAGGFIGANLNKRCSEQAVERAFNAVQLLVLAITIFNIIRNLMGG